MHESVTARASRRRKNGRLLSAQPKRVRGIQLVALGPDVQLEAAVTYNSRAIAATITGAVIGGGTPLADAVAFGQWKAARRLVERGARTTLWQAAALGLMDRVEKHFAGDGPSALAPWLPRPPRPDVPPPNEITHAFWCACHGSQREAAEFLLARGAALNWIGYDGLTPMDAARRSEAGALVEWLANRGAKSAKDLG